MKLTTKRNRWYFFRELFSYMIPSILIVWSIDVFYHFMQCPLHPEWSAPCSVNWILAAIYWIFLIITIILAILSANALRKVKKKIENEFIESINSNDWIIENKNIKKESEQDTKETIKDFKKQTKENNKPKRIIVNSDSTIKEKSIKKTTKKITTSKKVSTKKNIAKK